jgi:hypothetical protein
VTVTITASTLSGAPFTNQGTLLAQGPSAINGTFTTTAGSVVRAQGSSEGGYASLSILNGFTNNGTLELTNANTSSAQDAALTVTNGTLVNVFGASLSSQPGALGGGSRTLAAQLDNRGTLTMAQALTLSKASAAHSNTGMITLSGGDLTVSQSGTNPSFTNTGTITVQSQTFSITGGGLTVNASGILVSQPSGVIAINGTLVGTTRNANLFAPQGTLSLNGPGTSTAPQLLEVMSQDQGNVGAGFSRNFVYGSISLSNTYVRLVDNARNSSGTSPEALYVNALIVPAGTTLDLNGLHVYARGALIGGTVLGGIINLTPPGAFPLGSPSGGSITSDTQVDDWTLFGRAGQAVTVIVNTGAGGNPRPLQPYLNFATVGLLDPSSNVLATATSSQSGGDVALLAVTLPVDGTYHVPVRAGQGGSTGYYIITAYSATVHEAPLNLNETGTSQIDNPYRVERWTFTDVAGDQVRFDLVNSSTP